ncbi:MAG: putative efflux rane fusion protein [Gammaproteobacteria bacterium]|nr:putative efflux rane fusion protein [Gammaproteobacteria bacterium]
MRRIVFTLPWVALAAFLFWRLGTATIQPTKAGHPEDGIPVKASPVTRGPVDLSVSSVGTVLALNTVVLHPRVDGQIQSVRFKEGQLVSQGDILIELDPLPFRAQLHAAEAQRARDAAMLENAKLDFDRYEGLLKLDSTPAQTRDTALATVRQLTATLANDDALIESAKLSLSYATIRAPFPGRIGARLVDAGNVVHTTDTNGLAVLTQIHPITLNFALPQDLLPELREAQRRGPVPVRAASQDGRRTLAGGELSLIDNQIDAATGTVRCKATFSNSEDNLWPGQFATAVVRLREVPDALTVPTSAIQAGPEGSFVYVVSKDFIATPRPVRVIGVSDERSIVAEGLNGGERVVTEGQFRLEAGALVAIGSK